MQQIVITLLNMDRLSPQAVRTLGAILECYGAHLIALLSNGALSIVLPGSLVDAFLATVSRDVLPVEIETHA